jgi:hypothetical protein
VASEDSLHFIESVWRDEKFVRTGVLFAAPGHQAHIEIILQHKMNTVLAHLLAHLAMNSLRQRR